MSLMQLIEENKSINKLKPQLLVVNNTPTDNVKGRKTYCDLYIINPNDRSPIRRIALIDNGADINLISYDYLIKLIPKPLINQWKYKSDINNLSSYSQHKIPIKFCISVQCKFSSKGQEIALPFYVTNHITGSPPLLIGSGTLKDLMANLKYTGVFGQPEPQLILFTPTKTPVHTYFATEQELYTCTAHVKLDPTQSCTAIFRLHPASPCVKKDRILITGGGLVTITASITNLTFNHKVNAYEGQAMVTNFSATSYEGEVIGVYEIVPTDEYNSIPVKEENFKKLRNYTLLHEVYFTTSMDIQPTIQLLAPIPHCTPIISTLPQSVYRLARTDQTVTQPDNMTNKNKSERQMKLTENNYNDLNLDPALQLNENPMSDITKEELNKFYDKKYAIQHGPDWDDEGDLDPEVIEPSGYSIPDEFERSLDQIINIKQFENDHQPFIKNIFLDTYPQTVARSTLDYGNFSRTLGMYTIRLKPNEQLPRHRRIFMLTPSELQHMKDILDFFTQAGIFTRTKVTEDQNHRFGAPAYLVSRNRKDSVGRVVIDYRALNSIIQVEAPIMQDIPTTLHALREAILMSSLDLSNAFYSYSICPSSRHLTNFVCAAGSYTVNRLPTGLAASPEALAKVGQQMVHQLPVLNNDGQPVYDAPNLVRMVEAPLNNVHVYYDDILVATTAAETYEQTLQLHYQVVKEVVKRLAFHSAKINFEKSTFGKSKIRFLGWLIQNNFIIADPKRIQKILEAPFPPTKKAMQSFLGGLNSIKMAVPRTKLTGIEKLYQLTSIKNKYEFNQDHEKIFNKIKKEITEYPIFCKMISPTATKVLFTDSGGTDTSSYAAVLGQIVDTVESDNYIPPYLTFDDASHRIIFNKKLNCEPIPIITSEADLKAYKSASAQSTPIDDTYLSSKYLGFTEENVNDSLFISTISLQYIHNCKVMTSLDLREACIKKIKPSILGLKLKDFIFDQNSKDYHNFIDKLRSTQGEVDPDLYVVEALALVLTRPIIVISTLEKHLNSPILKYNGHINKPPFIYSLFQKENKLIFRPYFINKHVQFDLRKLQGKRFEIIAYHSKAIPETKKAKAIIDNELFAILHSLHHFRKFIGQAEVLLLTDSRPLYLIFSQPVLDSEVKIKRWSMKLSSDYANLKLAYIPSDQNLADFLSKKFHILPGDIPRIGLHRYCVPDLTKYLPEDKIFTIPEWITWVQANPQYLKIMAENTSVKYITASLTKITDNLQKHIQPLQILEERMSIENILKYQKQDLKELYKLCLSSANFLYKDKLTYQIINGLISVLEDDGPKLLVPPALIGLFITYGHLRTGHGGLLRMKAALTPYFITNKNKLITQLTSRCWPCFLVNVSNRKEYIGKYPIQPYPFFMVNLDLCENLNKAGRYQHILIVTDSLSGAILLYPLKSKTAEEVSHILLHSVLQHFNIKLIHSDNGPAFSNKNFLQLLAALGIRKLHLSSYNAPGKGFVERRVGMVKRLLKILLVEHSDFNWLALTYIVSKISNTSTLPTTKYPPYSLVYGPDSPHTKFAYPALDIATLHPLIEQHSTQIQNMSEKISLIIKDAQSNIEATREKQHEYKNKNRIHKDFTEGDIVFALDHSVIVGAPQPLRTQYNPSPYKIIKIYQVTALLKRLSDNFQTIYSLNQIKRFNPLDPIFSTLPPAIFNIIRSPEHIDQAYQQQLLQWDPLSIPNGEAFPTEDEINIDNHNTDENINIEPDHNYDTVNTSPNTVPTPQNDKTFQTNTKDSITLPQENVNTPSNLIHTDQNKIIIDTNTNPPPVPTRKNKIIHTKIPTRRSNRLKQKKPITKYKYDVPNNTTPGLQHLDSLPMNVIENQNIEEVTSERVRKDENKLNIEANSIPVQNTSPFQTGSEDITNISSSLAVNPPQYTHLNLSSHSKTLQQPFLNTTNGTQTAPSANHTHASRKPSNKKPHHSPPANSDELPVSPESDSQSESEEDDNSIDSSSPHKILRSGKIVKFK